jgi:hypothetical protein
MTAQRVIGYVTHVTRTMNEARDRLTRLHAALSDAEALTRGARGNG